MKYFLLTLSFYSTYVYGSKTSSTIIDTSNPNADGSLTKIYYNLKDDTIVAERHVNDETYETVQELDHEHLPQFMDLMYWPPKTDTSAGKIYGLMSHVGKTTTIFDYHLQFYNNILYKDSNNKQKFVKMQKNYGITQYETSTI